MDDLLARRIAAQMGKAPGEWERVGRGHAPAERWIVRFADGTSAFAKVGTSKATADGLRAEHALYSQLQADFLPKLLGFEDAPEKPLLLLEDLSGGHWPPLWREGDVERLLEAMRRLAATRPVPKGLPDQEMDRARFAGWLQIERNPKAFSSLGLCSREWLEGALPVLLMAQDLAILSGVDLVHGDIRSDNVCLLADRVVFVDWSHGRRGNAAFDLAGLAPSLRLEGGPLPDELLPEEGPLAALICGYYAANAGLPPIPDAPRVRRMQLRQLRVALPWAARALGLPPPDGSWARDAARGIDAELAGGRIDEAAWYAAMEEVSGDAHLAAAAPRLGSGSSDEAEWRWCRELALDALPPGKGPHHVLDVGAADGYLMESFERWGKERGVHVEPHGLESSPRLASLASRRLPKWRDRIHVGTALSWSAPRRYDLVHAALDHVPAPRRRQALERMRRELLTPEGRLVLRADDIAAEEADVVGQVEALGLEIGGVLTREHPISKAIYRTVWLAAR